MLMERHPRFMEMMLMQKAFKSGHFSKNRQLIVTASDDSTIILWDSRTREEVRTIVIHVGPVTSVAFGSDDFMVVSGGWDKQVFISDCRKKNS